MRKNHNPLHLQIREWVLKQDTFWLGDLSKEFNDTSDNHILTKDVIRQLKKENLIQCCTITKNKRKYIVLNPTLCQSQIK